MLNGSQSQHTSGPSVAALLGGIVNDAKDLLVHELALITIEVHDTLRKAKTAAIALGLGLAVVAIGGILLMLMLVQMLAAYTEIPLWGCYGILGGVLLAVGKCTVEAIDVVPQRTLETIGSWAYQSRSYWCFF